MEVTIYKMIFKTPKEDDYNEEEDYEENDIEENNEEENHLEENSEEDNLEEKKQENKEVKLKILDIEFLKNNKNKAKLIINNKKYNLKQFLKIKDYSDDNIKVKIILNRDIRNGSCMFKNCDLLLNLTIYNYNDNNSEVSNTFIELEENEKFSENVIYSEDDEHPIFKNLKNEDTISTIMNPLEDIETRDKSLLFYWNYNLLFSQIIYINLYGMFYNCESLISIPDISKWKTDNVIDMSYMFYNCYSLTSIPDISKWNTHNVIDMSYMFFGCESLLKIPDISNWKTNNTINMRAIFSSCISLLSLPDISS